MLLVVDQTLVEMAGTDGQAKKGRVVVEMSAVEAYPITVTSRLKKIHEEEISIPQVGWSWTIPRLDRYPCACTNYMAP